MNKKTPKKHSTLSNTLFALKWQFEIAPRANTGVYVFANRTRRCYNPF